MTVALGEAEICANLLLMALEIRDPETERLVAEVAGITGETHEVAVREALRERRDRVASDRPRRQTRYSNMHEFMEKEIWVHIPDHLLDREPMTKAEVEEILGIGPEGY